MINHLKVRKYCKNFAEIENYELAIADTENTWHAHHRLETPNIKGELRTEFLSREELITLGLYYDRPAEELILLPPKEHGKLHRQGKHLSEETKRKLSELNKGEKNPMYGVPSPNRRKIMCVETGQVFDSAFDTGVCKASECANGNRKTAGGFTWEWLEEK